MPKIIGPCRELANIRLLSCDVDGVLTDGGLYYDESGKELRKFHVHDGLGMQRLQAAGVSICIVTRSDTKAIQARAERLGLKYCFIGIENKLSCVRQIVEEIGISMHQVAHIGDDLNDLELLKEVGVPLTVPNAVHAVQAQCMFVTNKSGGMGAVREVADAILDSLE